MDIEEDYLLYYKRQVQQQQQNNQRLVDGKEYLYDMLLKILQFKDIQQQKLRLEEDAQYNQMLLNLYSIFDNNSIKQQNMQQQYNNQRDLSGIFPEEVVQKDNQKNIEIFDFILQRQQQRDEQLVKIQLEQHHQNNSFAQNQPQSGLNNNDTSYEESMIDDEYISQSNQEYTHLTISSSNQDKLYHNKQYVNNISNKFDLEDSRNCNFDNERVSSSSSKSSNLEINQTENRRKQHNHTQVINNNDTFTSSSDNRNNQLFQETSLNHNTESNQFDYSFNNSSSVVTSSSNQQPSPTIQNTSNHQQPSYSDLSGISSNLFPSDTRDDNKQNEFSQRLNDAQYEFLVRYENFMKMIKENHQKHNFQYYTNGFFNTSLLLNQNLDLSDNKQQNESEKQDNNKKQNDAQEYSTQQVQVQVKPKNLSILPLGLKWDQKMKIWGGLFLQEGVLRNQKGLIHISFGLQQEQIAKIDMKKNLNIVTLQFQKEHNLIKPPFKEAMKILDNYLISDESTKQIEQKIPNYSSKTLREMILSNSLSIVKDKLGDLIKQREQLLILLKDFQLDEEILQKKNENFFRYIQKCYEYFGEYDQDRNLIYSYVICRVNFFEHDIQMYESGYSQAYLNLLGIDADTFSSMMMRGQKIDLIKEKGKIHEQTLYTMLECLCNVEDIDIYTDIHTFDGFPLNLLQKQRKIHIPSEKQGDKDEFMLIVTEMDVDAFELQQLIMYRQRIAQKNQHLSYDDFIRKELSYLFEDVEYSVYSQSFFDKYYSKNLEQLQNLSQLQKLRILKPQNNINQVDNQPLKPVEYHFLSISQACLVQQ